MNEWMKIGNKNKPTLLLDMIFNGEKPKESTKKITTINISGFSKVTEYKVNIQKAIVFVFTNNEQLEI